MPTPSSTLRQLGLRNTLGERESPRIISSTGTWEAICNRPRTTTPCRPAVISTTPWIQTQEQEPDLCRVRARTKTTRTQAFSWRAPSLLGWKSGNHQDLQASQIPQGLANLPTRIAATTKWEWLDPLKPSTDPGWLLGTEESGSTRAEGTLMSSDIQIITQASMLKERVF